MPHSRRVVLLQLAATGALAACSGPSKDAAQDSGFKEPEDTGITANDTGPVDSGPVDSGPVDTGPVDTGPVDTGPVDTGVSEPGFPDERVGECLTDAPLEECVRTPPSGEGPYYRETIPYRDNLNVRGEEGLHVVMTGRIVKEDGCTPIADAELHVWHAAPSSDQYEMRDDDHHCMGRVVADAQGYYCFYTLRPQPYPNGDNTGFLAAHFHFHVVVDGDIVFTGQTYFEGDEYLASFTPPELIKTEVPVEEGVVAIEHDFVVPSGA